MGQDVFSLSRFFMFMFLGYILAFCRYSHCVCCCCGPHISPVHHGAKLIKRAGLSTNSHFEPALEQITETNLQPRNRWSRKLDLRLRERSTDRANS